MALVTFPSVVLLFATTLGLPAAAGAAPGQRDLPRGSAPRVERDAGLPLFLNGIVLGPGGAPAAGAVVVSSAGGRAVTELDGRYRLEVRVAHDAETIQVTATRPADGETVAATTSVALFASRIAQVGPLVLEATCQPSWAPTFGSEPGVSAYGTSGDVDSLLVFDDGSGPALFASGSFQSAGGTPANGIARWDGVGWSALGDGLDDGAVSALAVFDDGTGAALYAGGNFQTAGSVAASGIARWDGVGWSALGDGIGGGAAGALAVFDDGTGAALYAGGLFQSAGGVPANGIARWSGSSWSAVGSGMNHSIYALCVFDDGSGPALYAGGVFTTAGGTPANRIAKWNGASWSAVGSGTSGGVFALAVFDDGSGPALHAAGAFTIAGGVAASRIAKWNGASWTALGTGVNDSVQALAVLDDGSGAALYAGGSFTTAGGGAANRIARWNGSAWSALRGGIGEGVNALAACRNFRSAGALPGQNMLAPVLFVGGSFTRAGDAAVSGIAQWRGRRWYPCGGRGLNGGVTVLTVFDDGSGPALHAAGRFTNGGSGEQATVARWHGSGWVALEEGMGDSVRALVGFDDGTGPALYAAGSFHWVDGDPVNCIAKWDGTNWNDLGGGLSVSTSLSPPFAGALAVFDDGGGPALYAGGDFLLAGGTPASCIAKWNGLQWSPLASGIGFGNRFVAALAVFDDGGGPALYAGGEFDAPGLRIAKWDGTSWTALAGGTNGTVLALAVFDDGSGSALYAAGSFTSAGGVAANHVARWDGSSWAALGSGMDDWVHALTVFDDGSGPALYAGGSFTTAGGAAASQLAKWSGSSWTPLGSGTYEGGIDTLTVFDDGSGPALCAGGSFIRAPDSGDSFLALWRGCP